ncbi:hypothetical protein E0L36_08490 [Streptomyces sp. AJS327]|uniref:hypothetical protein n=1 Tax=Streptomyces sp. AJS327 TaxID=2545265 RepID=UPI0015DF79F2|nr:hypothetical protein [Streptomyces sp. AJS327]MBA0050930.1 hypothetical protein [Streptomyces sp. AJS327]
MNDARGDTAWDTAPLTGRLSRARWHRYRAETVAGRHGTELARPSWRERSEHAVLAVVFGVGVPALPLALFVTGAPTALAICASALWSGSTLMALYWSRRDLWRPRVRARFRLAEFARVNGMEYRPEPEPRRLAAHVSGAAARRRHRDRITVPGPRGFAVARYEETSGGDDAEGWSVTHGYAVFRLRESCPRTLVARRSPALPRELKDVEPVGGPAGTSVWSAGPTHPLLGPLLGSGVVEQARGFGRSVRMEIVGTELFLIREGFWPMRSPRLWRRLSSVAQALAPFLDTTDRVDPAKCLVPYGR